MKQKNFLTLFVLFFNVFIFSQTIQEYNYNVSGGFTESYDNPGTILYPTGFTTYNTKTPVIFVHGITGKLSGSYEANIDQVQNFNLNAAFVQLKPLGSTIENGKLLSKMINHVKWHYNVETVSIVAHSKGGLDTERALYGQNAYTSSNLPTFSYEDVDGVYTFSSPVRGARVADVGATLSWFSGISWAIMWYTNGWSLTSGTVNGFHNWAEGWTINSTDTFANAYNPYGASYYRNHMSEDNTTRWWAHQSNDECYNDVWYYCYIGRPFQHSVGAYIDAYWEWDWFDSGWRNWHSSSDGFISEYRAKRYANDNASPYLTPGSGDSNYRTVQDANHSSLWEIDENHFTNEVGWYLHYGLYNGSYSMTPTSTSHTTTNLPHNRKDATEVQNSNILASNGNLYYAKNGEIDIIVEEDNRELNFIIYGDQKIENFILINKKTKKRQIIDVIDSKKDDFSDVIVNAAHSFELKKGVYTLQTNIKDFLAIVHNENSSTAFAVNYNFDETKGYNNELIEVGIANKDKAIDFDSVIVTADLTKVANNHKDLIKIGQTQMQHFVLNRSEKKGFYNIQFNDLTPGSIYSLRIEATSTEGDVLLSRNTIHSFYVKEDIEMKTVSVNKQIKPAINNNINSINVFPNPTTNNVTVSSNTKNNIDKIELLDNKGIVIKTFNISQPDFNFSVKDLGLPIGFYNLRISMSDTVSVQRLVIE